MPTPRRTLLVLLVALLAATGLASAWANETPRSSFVVATRAEPATDAGLDDASPDGVADGSASDSGAADALPPVVADAANGLWIVKIEAAP